jgi:hypothetical protein
MGFYDAWDDPPKPPGTVHILRPVAADAEPYALAALNAEVERVATAANGSRNHTLNRATFSLAQLVAGGALTEATVREHLEAAAHTCGLDATEITATIDSGFRGGLQHPRGVPEADQHYMAVTVLDAASGQRTVVAAPDAKDALADRLVLGGAFVLDVPETTPAVWGRDQDILWAEGESLIIAAGNGAGKTTLAGQLVRGRLGLSRTVLGYNVAPGNKRVLYLAMDRPQQIARALRRHFTHDERERLDERLVVWKGPPPADLARTPELLLSLVQAADADTVVVDSLKDAAIGLSDDEVGAGWNRARQYVIAHGCQVLELHHNVKRNPNGGDPSTISDIYGSAWITAGVGSAILLVGAPGDPVVQMRHVKQPADEVGPLKLLHDHDRGVTGIFESATPFEIVQRLGSATAKKVAEVMFESEKVTPAEKMKAARKLERLVDQGLLACTTGSNTNPSVYRVAGPTTLGGER